MRITSAYSQPSEKFDENEFMRLVSHDQLPLIITGDLNAKHGSWNSRRCNIRGKALLQCSINNQQTIISPTEPTHFHSQGHRLDILDIYVLRGVNHYSSIDTLRELSSNHYPILLDVVEENQIDNELTPQLVTCSQFTTSKHSRAWIRSRRHHLQNQSLLKQLPSQSTRRDSNFRSYLENLDTSSLIAVLSEKMGNESWSQRQNCLQQTYHAIERYNQNCKKLVLAKSSLPSGSRFIEIVAFLQSVPP